MPAPQPPPRPQLTEAVQAAYPEEVLDALHDRLVLWTQLKDRVVEWSGNPAARVPVEGGTYVVALDIPAIRPAKAPGGGVQGWPVEYLASVTLWTRYEGTQTGERRQWNRRHFPALAWAFDAVIGKLLYSGYGPGSGAPTGRCLTTGLTLPLENQTVKTELESAFGYSTFTVVVPSILPIDFRRLV